VQFGAPSGWTALFSPFFVDDGNTIGAYYRFDPPGAPTFTSSGSAAAASVLCQAYGGVDAAAPVDVTAATAVTSPYGSTLAVGGVTTVTPGARLVSGCLIDSPSNTITEPGGMTGVVDASGGGVGASISLADEDRSSAGATGTRTWSHDYGGTLGMGAFLAALRPARSRPPTLNRPARIWRIQ
jgi:hypothetical protein